MEISVINYSRVSDHDVQRAIRSINRQISEDFFPYWGINGQLRLEGHSNFNKKKIINLRNLRGQALILIVDKPISKGDDSYGFHDIHSLGIPLGFVHTGMSKELNEPWEVTFSHEALELIADPENNRLVMGPHPDRKNYTAFHWYEVCDAVQDEYYKIDGVYVSNFVLPLYFTERNEGGGRNDFLGNMYKGKSLKSFGLNPGGYLGYFDPKKGEHVIFENDAKAKKRAKIKGRFSILRRSARYKNWGKPPPPLASK